MSSNIIFGALLGGIFVACAVPFVIAKVRGRKIDPFEISVVFVANYFLGFWLKPLLSLVAPDRYSAWWYQRELHDDATIAFSLSLVLLGLFAFYAGYYGLGVGRRASWLIPVCRWPWIPRRVWIALVISSIVAGLTFWYFVQRGEYSLEYLALNRGEVVAGVGLVAWLFVVSSILVFLIVLLFGMQPGASRFAKVVYTLSAVTIGVGLLSIFASRGNILLVLGSVLVVRHYCVRRVSLTKVVLIFIGVVVLSASVFVWRGWTVSGETPPFDSLAEVITADLISISTGWEGFIMAVEWYPRYGDYYYGAIAGGDLIWLIPRMFWEGKPARYGGVLVQEDVLPGLLSYETGLGTYESFSPLGYGYADFGVAGALAAMLAHGIFWRTLYEHLKRSGGTPSAAAAYGLFVLSLSTYARGLVGSFLAVLVLWVPIVLVMGWLGKGAVGRRSPTGYGQYRRVSAGMMASSDRCA